MGKTPFHGKNADEVFNNILQRKLSFPDYLIKENKEVVDLIDKLLDANPDNRIGMKGI